MSDSTNFRSPEKGVRLFYQIALRLVAVAAIFAVLEVVIVVAMYVDDPETLSEDLVSVESRRIANLVAEYGVSANVPTLLRESSTRAVAIFDSSGNRLLVDNPGRLPLPGPPVADVQSSTSRETHGKQFFLTGIRRIDIDGRPLWIALAISGEGLRPFVPALYKEVCDHALLPLIPLSMLLLLFNVVVVRRMLKPLERAVVEVDALDPSGPSRRLHQPVSPVEVSSLLGAINRALDRLERAMQTLRRFTADAAHELRTPLAAMTLTIERLPPSVERQELVQDAAGMTRLIGQMLDLARTDALDDMRQSRSDLHDVASRVAAEMAPVAIGLGRSICYRNDGSSTVEGRAEILERAVRNLIENALSHSPQGSEIEVTVGPGPGGISVRDHGPGIPLALREKVFERFWRADRRHGGAGLGLAITRSIMEACGGRVEISDAPDGGAIVALVFPELAP